MRRAARADRAQRAVITALLVCSPWLVASAGDPGVLIELDLDAYQVRVRDLASGAEGPELRVVLGSPAHPTPSGDYRLNVVVRNPGWKPGAIARASGARPVPPSPAGPLGVGKIPFAQGGEIALHGGANPLLLGKPVSLGCARATDEDLLRLITWLEDRRALERPVAVASGELLQYFRRPARVSIH
jgi:L,D-transpeptidase catalytic domain